MTMTSQSVLALEPRLRPRLGADAQVSRAALLDFLEVSSRTPVVAIIAPPGYGKTTLLAQWAECDPRAFGWLTIARRDNDPSILMRDLAAAFVGIEPTSRDVLDAMDAPGTAVVDVVLPALCSVLATSALPAVLVLDDLHLLTNRDCLDAVTRLIDYLPVDRSSRSPAGASRRCRWRGYVPRGGWWRSVPRTWRWTARRPAPSWSRRTSTWPGSTWPSWCGGRKAGRSRCGTQPARRSPGDSVLIGRSPSPGATGSWWTTCSPSSSRGSRRRWSRS